MRYSYVSNRISLLYVCSTIRIESFVRLVNNNNKIRVTARNLRGNCWATCVFGCLWHANWMWRMATGRRAHHVKCDGEAGSICSRVRLKSKSKNKTNKRKINDFQQNLLSINLSSEAVVDATATTVAAAYFVQNLNKRSTCRQRGGVREH